MIILSTTRILTDGLILSVGLSILIFGSLYMNPRLWLQDYPKEIQAKVPPKTLQETRTTWVLLVLFLAMIIGTLVYSVTQLKAETGSISFINAFVHAFLVFNIFNLVDAVIIDLLVLTFINPKFAEIPGAEGMEYLYRDWNMQFRNYLRGIVVCAVFSLPIAFVMSL